jgi:hypothetical protein
MPTLDQVRGDTYKGYLFDGQCVHCILYGGMDGYITKIEGHQSPETIKDYGGIVMGGNANITVKFANGHTSVVPESIVRGVQWYIDNPPITDSDNADNLIKSATIDIQYNTSVKQNADKQAAKIDLRNKQYEDLPKIYNYLETVKAYELRTGKHYCDRICATKNIKKELTLKYPGIKFSIKSETYSGGNSIDVTWYDGPTQKEVDSIIHKYNDHETDYTGDYRDPTNDVFNELYGGAKYVFSNRHMSDETLNALKTWAQDLIERKDHFANNSCGIENLIWKLVSEYNIPANHNVVGVKHTDCNCGCHISDFYGLVFSENN